MTAEVLEHGHAVIDSTGRENIFSEFISRLRIEDIARFFKGLEGITVKNFCPHIAVIAGCVASAHGMAEISHTVAGEDLLGETAASEHLCLKSHHVQIFRNLLENMQIHIHIGGGNIFYRRKSLSVFGAFFNLFEKFHWNQFTRLIMTSVNIENFRFKGPMFVQLGRQFHKVAFCAADSLIVDVAHKAVERMAEFMEHGIDIIDALQSGFIPGGGGHVADVEDDGENSFLAVVALRTEAGAPGSGSFAGTGIVIAVEEGQHFAVLVDYFPGLSRLFIDRELIGAFFESQSIEFIGNEEESFDDVIDFQVGGDFIFIDRVSGLFGLVLIIHEVARISSISSAAFRRAGVQT